MTNTLVWRVKWSMNTAKRFVVLEGFDYIWDAVGWSQSASSVYSVQTVPSEVQEMHLTSTFLCEVSSCRPRVRNNLTAHFLDYYIIDYILVLHVWGYINTGIASICSVMQLEAWEIEIRTRYRRSSIIGGMLFGKNGLHHNAGGKGNTYFFHYLRRKYSTQSVTASSTNFSKYWYFVVVVYLREVCHCKCLV